MPRIPTLDGPSVQLANPYQQTAPQQHQPDYSTANTINAVGGLVQRAGKMGLEGAQMFDAERLKAQKEAADLELSGALLQLDSGLSDRAVAFSQLQGTAASADRAKAVDDFDTLRNDMATGIVNRAARDRFLKESVPYVEARRRQVDGHALREFEAARVDTAKAAVSSYLSSAESLQDPDVLALHQGLAERSIRANSNSPEAADAAVKEMLAEGNYRLVQSLVAKGQGEDAIAVVEQHRAALGSRYTDAEKLVGDVRRAKATGEAVVSMADQLRNADGLVDVSALQAKAASTPVPVSDIKAFGLALDRQLRVEQAKMKNEVAKYENLASQAHVDKREIDTPVREWLYRNDARFLSAYDAKVEAERLLAAKRARGPSHSREADGMQRAVDLEAQHLYRAELYNHPDLPVSDFLKDYLSRKAGEGHPVSISDVGLSVMKEDSSRFNTKDVAGEAKTAASAERSYAGHVEGMLKGAPGARKGKVLDESLLQQRKGWAMQEYDRRVAQNGGKPLDQAQLSALDAYLVTNQDREVPRRILGFDFGTSTQKQVGVDTLKPAAGGDQPAPKKRKHRLNPKTGLLEPVGE